MVGVFLQRHEFRGRSLLVALLTLPLAFPGVVIGFMVIMLAGRQGLIGDLTAVVTGERSCSPTRWPASSWARVLLHPASDPHHHGGRREARSTHRGSGTFAGGGRLARRPRRHPAGFEAGSAVGRRDLLRDGHGRLRHGLHLGHADRGAPDDDLYGIHPAGEHRGCGGPLLRVGALTWLVLAVARTAAGASVAAAA